MESIRENFFSSPVIENENLYIGGDDHNFYRINTATLSNQ